MSNQTTASLPLDGDDEEAEDGYLGEDDDHRVYGQTARKISRQLVHGCDDARNALEWLNEIKKKHL